MVYDAGSLFRSVLADSLGAICLELAMLFAFVLPLLRLLVDDGMPCCWCLTRYVASFAEFLNPWELASWLSVEWSLLRLGFAEG